MLYLFWWYLKFLLWCVYLEAFLLVVINLAGKLGYTRASFFLYYILATLSAFLASHIPIPCGPIYKPFTPALYNYISCVHTFLFRMMGIKFKLMNPENLSLDQGAIVIANHQSIADPFCLFSIWPYAKSMTVVAKKSAIFLWPFGFSMWLLGGKFIDRSNLEAARTTLNEVAMLAVRKKTKVLLFPEGTRNKTATKTRRLLPFKKGPFRVAIDCQVPIIPVVISPYYWVNNDYKYFKQGEGMIRVLEPVSTDGMTQENMLDLMEKIRTAMQDCYTEMVQEIEATLPPDHPYMLVKPH